MNNEDKLGMKVPTDIKKESNKILWSLTKSAFFQDPLGCRASIEGKFLHICKFLWSKKVPENKKMEISIPFLLWLNIIKLYIMMASDGNLTCLPESWQGLLKVNSP